MKWALAEDRSVLDFGKPPLLTRPCVNAMQMGDTMRTCRNGEDFVSADSDVASKWQAIADSPYCLAGRCVERDHGRVAASDHEQRPGATNAQRCGTRGGVSPSYFAADQINRCNPAITFTDCKQPWQSRGVDYGAACSPLRAWRKFQREPLLALFEIVQCQPPIRKQSHEAGGSSYRGGSGRWNTPTGVARKRIEAASFALRTNDERVACVKDRF